MPNSQNPDQPITALAKVLIVEDHHATLDGLFLGLSNVPGLTVVGTASTSDEGLRLLKEHRPDVTVLDLHLPGSMGPKATIEAFRAAAGEETKLIIFSAESRMAFIQSVLAMGVSAYLLKSERVAKVAETIQAVLAGKSGLISDEVTKTYKKITRAEMEVLTMLGRGMKYQDIADHRVTSVATARKQCETLLLKLGLETREQLIAWAVQNGFGSVEMEN
ncbi:MAG: response regulator transcription factor [Candidatus Obscuribacterales bacterium]|jgi:NarL family two-component system response regulator LiaR